MKLVFLGTGACIPAPGDDTASYFVEGGLLIDVGWHVTETLRRCGKTPSDVQSVLFTHCHHDHVMALPALLYERFANNSAGNLHIYGPEAIRGVYERAERYLEVEKYWPEAQRPTLHILSDGECFETCGYEIKAIASRHAVPGFCYRVTERGGASVGFSGDTAYFEELGEFFKGCDALVHEYSWGERKSEENLQKHSDIADASNVAREAGVRTLYPVHGPKALKEKCGRIGGAIFTAGKICWPEPNDSIEV